MKNINMKKIVAGAAALGVSALLAGSVVAANVNGGDFGSFNELTKDQLFTSGVPAYNIVVGSMGQTIDVVWAGNIAAAIGKMAYTTAGTVGGAALQDVTIEVGSSSTSTSVSGDGKLYNSDYLGNVSTFTPSLKDSTFTKLVNMDVEYDDTTGDSDTLKNVKDTIDLKFTDVYYESNKDVQSLLMKIPGSTGVTYTLNLDSGIPANLTTSDDHDMTIPFMGEMYTVKSSSYDKIELISEANKQSYMQGETFTIEGAGSYSGQELVIEVSTVSNNARVLLKLMDGTNNVLSSETVREGKSTTFGGKSSEITVPTVNYADGGNSYVEVTQSSGAALTLKDGDMVDALKEGEREWEVNFTCAVGACDAPTDLITKIVLTNADGWDQLPIDGDEDYPALKPGESAILPGGLGTVNFIGLKNEAMYDLETKNGMIKWTDKDDETHEVPLYQERADNARMSIDIDGKTYYFHYNAGNTITVREGSDDTSDVVAGGIFTVTQNSGGSDDTGSYVVTTAGLAAMPIGTNTYADVAGTAVVPTSYFYLTSDVDDSTKLYFTIVDNGSQWGVALAPKVTLTAGNLDVDTTHVYPLADATNGWKFTGTDDDATGGVDAFYFNGKLAKNTGMSIFSVVDVDSLGTSGVNFVIDPNTKKLANSKDYSGNPTLTYKIKYDESTVATYDFVLDDEDSDDRKTGITLRGSELEISSGEFKISQPEKQRAFEVFVGSDAVVDSTTVLNGGTLVLSTPGTVVETEDGKVSAKLVSANVTGSESMTAMTPGNWNVNNNRLVWLDQEAPSTPLIIVGGYKVNSLAVGTYGLEDIVTVSGQYVAGIAENNNLIVAGMDAADTAAAAKELITAIENM